MSGGGSSGSSAWPCPRAVSSGGSPLPKGCMRCSSSRDPARSVPTASIRRRRLEFAGASFPQGPRPADRQCHPLVPLRHFSLRGAKCPCRVTCPNSAMTETTPRRLSSVAAQFCGCSKAGPTGRMACASAALQRVRPLRPGQVRSRPAGRCPPFPTPPMTRRRRRYRADPGVQGPRLRLRQ